MPETSKAVNFVKFTDEPKSLFFATLRKRVDRYFADNLISKNHNSAMVIKTIVLLLLYTVPFLATILFKPPFAVLLLLWILMGFGLAGIGMSIMHDANHGAYSKNKLVNKFLGHTLNIIGGSVLNWKLQHNVLHHTYTNIANIDDDIEDRVLLRFNPHSRVKAIQKLQYLYAFLFYGILTFYWALMKDFVQYFRYKSNGVNSSGKRENTIFLMRLIIDKILYFGITLGLPILAGIPPGIIVICFFAMHFVAGLVLTIIFQMAHTVEGTTHPLPDNEGTIRNNWAIHQMHTTVNFAHGNKFLTWYVGGLNYQVEHHLFPKICHVHYPKIAPIVRATALEFGIPYLENKTFGDALRSHLRTLKRFGKLPGINDAIG